MRLHTAGHPCQSLGDHWGGGFPTAGQGSRRNGSGLAAVMDLYAVMTLAAQGPVRTESVPVRHAAGHPCRMQATTDGTAGDAYAHEAPRPY